VTQREGSEIDVDPVSGRSPTVPSRWRPLRHPSFYDCQSQNDGFPTSADQSQPHSKSSTLARRHRRCVPKTPSGASNESASRIGVGDGKKARGCPSGKGPRSRPRAPDPIPTPRPRPSTLQACIPADKPYFPTRPTDVPHRQKSRQYLLLSDSPPFASVAGPSGPTLTLLRRL